MGTYKNSTVSYLARILPNRKQAEIDFLHNLS